MKTRIFTREELQNIRKERTRTMELDLSVSVPTLEPPNPFPAVPAQASPPPPPLPHRMTDLEAPCKLPLSRPGPTDQRSKPVDIHYSGLIRRKPRRSN